MTHSTLPTGAPAVAASQSIKVVNSSAKVINGQDY